jgi:LysR family glycine cleavage system transcriptional activator
MLTNMSRLPLATLPTFCAVARRANLRAAAEALHLTHSAVSQQIQQLEQRLGVPLFERRQRRLVLNAAGAALLAAVEPALDRIAAGAEEAVAQARGQTRQLRISLLPSFTQRWMLPRMARWREAHPDIAIELHASHQLVDLAREGFHAAVRYGQGQWPGLVSERLMNTRLLAVAAPALASALAGLSPAELLRQPLLGDPEEWAAWAAQAGLAQRPVPLASFNDAGLMAQACELGLGVALTRELLLADALLAGTLVQVSEQALPDDSRLGYWLVYRPEQAELAPLVAFRQWMRNEIQASGRALARRQRALRPAAGTAAAGSTGSRSRAASGTRARPAR